MNKPQAIQRGIEYKTNHQEKTISQYIYCPIAQQEIRIKEAREA